MKDEEVFRFDPRRQSFRSLVENARKRGISVMPDKSIIIRRIGWKEGFACYHMLSARYGTFSEALRSFDHAIESIRARLPQMNECRAQAATCLHFLDLEGMPVEERKQEILAHLEEIRDALRGVRSVHLVTAKTNLAGEKADHRTLEELVENHEWPAARAKAVMIRNQFDRQSQRLLGQIPKLAVKKRLLGMIWDHDKQRVAALLQKAESFERAYLQTWVSAETLALVFAELEGLNIAFGSQFYTDLQNAKKTFLKLEQNLREFRERTRSADELLEKGLRTLREHQNWLLREDSAEAQKPAQILLFSRAAS